MLMDEEMLLKATNAFSGVVNNAATTITLAESIMTSGNIDAIKNALFGSGNWDQITFITAPTPVTT